MIGAGVGGAGYGVGGELVWGARGGAIAGYGMGAEVVWGARGGAGARVIPTGPSSRGDRLGVVAAPLRHAVRRSTPRPSLEFVPASMSAAGPCRGRRAVAAPLLARLPGSRRNQLPCCLPHAQAEDQEGMASGEKEEPKTPPVKPLTMWGILKKAAGYVLKSSAWAAVGGLLLFITCSILGYYSAKGNKRVKLIVDVLDQTNKAYKPFLQFAVLVIAIVLLLIDEDDCVGKKMQKPMVTEEW